MSIADRARADMAGWIRQRRERAAARDQREAAARTAAERALGAAYTARFRTPDSVRPDRGSVRVSRGPHADDTPESRARRHEFYGLRAARPDWSPERMRRELDTRAARRAAQGRASRA